MTPAPPVAGLPEGVELVRIGLAGDEDFELVGGTIFRGKRAGAASGVIVRPAKGYTFQPLQTWGGITQLWIPGPPNAFMVAKQLEVPEMITATLKIAVTDASEKKIVEDALEALKSLPGFMSLER